MKYSDKRLSIKAMVDVYLLAQTTVLTASEMASVLDLLCLDTEDFEQKIERAIKNVKGDTYVTKDRKVDKAAIVDGGSK